MATLDKDLLNKQVDVFEAWGKRKNVMSRDYDSWLRMFVNGSAKTDILDVTEEDVQLFYDKIRQVARTDFEEMCGRKAIRGLVKFYAARGRNHQTRETQGRPPNLSEIEQVKKYRKMGLKLREIERLTGKRVSQIHRWIRYTISK